MTDVEGCSSHILLSHAGCPSTVENCILPVDANTCRTANICSE